MKTLRATRQRQRPMCARCGQELFTRWSELPTGFDADGRPHYVLLWTHANGVDGCYEDDQRWECTANVDRCRRPRLIDYRTYEVSAYKG